MSNYQFKQIVKNLANFLSLLLILPLFLTYKFMLNFTGDKDRVFWAFSQFLSIYPGILGSYLRKNFFSLTMKKCDRTCSILFGTIFSHVDTEIGKTVYIGPQCNIGKCKIEDHCTIGSGVHILSGKNQHNFSNPDIPIQEQGGFFEKIILGEDAWIGNCAVIMANIGKKCIVGAGSVVTKDVEDYSIVAGNPAKLIRKRL